MDKIPELTPENLVQMVKHLKQPMRDVSISKVNPKNTITQVKYDGWWTALVFDHHVAKFVTSGAEIRQAKQLEYRMDAVIIGEWMYGTNWSQTHNPGHFHAHDIAFAFDRDQEYMPYIHRLSALAEWWELYMRLSDEDRPINIHMTMNICQPEERAAMWDKHVEHGDYEGFVFKDLNHMWGQPFERAKGKVTQDYVCMGFTEGAGRLSGKLGAILGGLYINGKLEQVVSVGGGYTDKLREAIWAYRHLYQGKVFEATGFELFPSGSLRHPNFSKWREDKLPESCILNANDNLDKTTENP